MSDYFADLSSWLSKAEEHSMADYINRLVYRNRLRNGFFVESGSSGSYQSDEFSLRYTSTLHSTNPIRIQVTEK
jgi:hypothetical protein